VVAWQEAMAHPMRLHWEYLSYLFRKLPVLSANEELERGYRDFLQVPISPACLLCSFARVMLTHTWATTAA
jgi:hypothetical protein